MICVLIEKLTQNYFCFHNLTDNSGKDFLFESVCDGIKVIKG